MANYINLSPPPSIVGSSSQRTSSRAESGDSRVLNIVENRDIINLIRSSRLNGDTANVVGFLKSQLGELPDLNERFVEENPLLSMITLILKGDPAEDHLRDHAVATYKNQYPSDTRFEANYAYLRDPTLLVTHLLITTGAWRCANPKNNEFYDEQMAGSFQGTIAFDIGDELSREELALIQKREDPNTPYPIRAKLEEKGDGYVVKGWCSTGCMLDTKSRVDDLYIPSRRDFQKKTIASFIQALQETSVIISEKYQLPTDILPAAVCVIGPYGAGKSHFIGAKFEQKVTTYSLDQLNERLKSLYSTSSDHHFEAMMLTRDLLTQLADVPAIAYEGASIDKWRFTRMVGRDFSTRHIIIEEMSTATPEKAVDNFIARETGNGTLLSDSRRGAAQTSATDAQRFRKERIESVQSNPKIHYTLYCEGAIVATVQNGVLAVAEGQQELYHALTPPNT